MKSGAIPYSYVDRDVWCARCEAPIHGISQNLTSSEKQLISFLFVFAVGNRLPCLAHSGLTVYHGATEAIYILYIILLCYHIIIIIYYILTQLVLNE